MNKRSFIKSTVALAALVSLNLIYASPASAAQESGKPQLYELRVYTTKSEQQQKLINDYWKNAAVPAYNRLGIQPIGVFTELEDSPTNKVYVQQLSLCRKGLGVAGSGEGVRGGSVTGARASSHDRHLYF